jgi:hypothetical protein
MALASAAISRLTYFVIRKQCDEKPSLSDDATPMY